MPFLFYGGDHLRSNMRIISGPGSFSVQFGDHLRSRDHLRNRTVLIWHLLLKWAINCRFPATRIYTLLLKGMLTIRDRAPLMIITRVCRYETEQGICIRLLLSSRNALNAVLVFATSDLNVLAPCQPRILQSSMNRAFYAWPVIKKR